MRTQLKKALWPWLIVAGVTFAAFEIGRIVAGPLFVTTAAAAHDPSSTSQDELHPFAALEPIDAHVHAFKSDPVFADLLARLRLHVLDICVADTQRSFGTSQPKPPVPRASCKPAKAMPGCASP